MFGFKKPNSVKTSSKEDFTPAGFRRVLGLLPEASNGREVKGTDSLRFHHLLVSLEGSERTGCLKIVSSKRMSRSAILLYKGRVVGCVYGQRSLGFQYLAQDAHKFALADLASPGNTVDAYELPEDLVLATASLFSGQTLNMSSGMPSEQACKQALSSIMQSNLPGCVVVNDSKDEIKAIVYLAEGKIVGLHTADSGWVAPKIESLSKILQNNVQISASVIATQESVNPEYGFSLTGLADRTRLVSRQQVQAMDALTSIIPSYAPTTPSHIEPATNRPSGRGNTAGPTRIHRARHAAHGHRTHEASTFTISPR